MRIAYASFDVVPAPKGASVHIERFVGALGARFDGVELFTVADVDGAPPLDLSGVRHRPLAAEGATMIDRALAFRRRLLGAWPEGGVDVAHVRSIFEGYPIARRRAHFCRALVFEVNGLPSIELKYHHPEVADDAELVRKLRAQEDFCLLAADRVVTPSEVTAAHLRGRGVDPARLHVIPNGVDLERFDPGRFDPDRVDPDRVDPGRPRPTIVSGAPGPRLLYAGTMAPWQGVGVALEALALLRREVPASLVLAGPGRRRQLEGLERRARTLGVTEALEIHGAVSRDEVVRLHAEADVVLAPLLANDRNLVQGCSPIKVIEAMASGRPLVASDLPVVRELAWPEREAILVRPGSAKAVKDAVLALHADPLRARRIASAARERVERELGWERAEARLLEVYAGLFAATSRESTLARPAASTFG